MRYADLYQHRTNHHLAHGFHGGLVLSPPDARDHRFGVMHSRALPTSPVDVSRLMPPATDQGQTGSCVAHAYTKLRHALVNRWRESQGQGDELTQETFSPLWEYYWTRAAMGTFPQDSGSDMRTACQAMLDHSAVLDADLPWDPATAPQDIQRDLSSVPEPSAQYYGISGYQRVGGPGMDMVASIIAALQQGYPVGVAILVYSDFWRNPDGHTLLPQRGAKLLGGHGIPVDKFIPDGSGPGGGWMEWDVSWPWGTNGRAWLPVAYLANKRLTPEAWLLV